MVPQLLGTKTKQVCVLIVQVGGTV